MLRGDDDTVSFRVLAGASVVLGVRQGSVIVFRDPDNIQLELWLPAA